MNPREAIDRNLYLGAPPKAMSMYNMHWNRPVRVEDDKIIMEDGDCGGCKPTWSITFEEWERCVEQYGLWKSAGIWSFIPFDDPAANAIRLCERDPHSAGRRLYELEEIVKRYDATMVAFNRSLDPSDDPYRYYILKSDANAVLETARKLRGKLMKLSDGLRQRADELDK